MRAARGKVPSCGCRARSPEQASHRSERARFAHPGSSDQGFAADENGFAMRGSGSGYRSTSARIVPVVPPQLLDEASLLLTEIIVPVLAAPFTNLRH